MMTEQIEALLFDLGRVVMRIEFERTFAIWSRHAGCAPEVLAARFSEDAAYRQHEVGAISSSEYFDSLRRSLGIDLTDGQWLEGWTALFAGEMPGMSRLLATAARRLPIYAFSNTNRAHTEYWPGRYDDLLGHFRQVFLSCEIGLRKPDVAAFGHVVGEMAVDPAKVLFFDDVAENVAGARTAGLQSVHVMTPDCVAGAVAERLGI